MRRVLAFLILSASVAAGYAIGYVGAFRRQEGSEAILGRMNELDRAQQLLRFVQRLDGGDEPDVRFRMTEYASAQIRSDRFTGDAHRHLPVREILVNRISHGPIDSILLQRANQNHEQEAALNDLLGSVCATSGSGSADYNAACRR